MNFEWTLITVAALALGGLVGDWLLGWLERRNAKQDLRQAYLNQWRLPDGQEDALGPDN